jgi:hypothetical protein
MEASAGVKVAVPLGVSVGGGLTTVAGIVVRDWGLQAVQQ